MEDAILVMNAGSSSLKFQVYLIESGGVRSIRRGAIDGIGVSPRMRILDADKKLIHERKMAPTEVPDLPSAIAEMTGWLQTVEGIQLRAIGHRIVHGGPNHADPVQITPEIIEELTAFQELAPLHQPNNLAPIRLAMQVAPHVPQIACFDTAFHRGHPEHTDCYALPKSFYDNGMRRYGFHGLSYKYISQKLREIAPDLAVGRVIVAHLGSGASMCALQNGVSIESTMGFTALDGIPMGTRPGQLDSGVVLYMMSHMGKTAQEITDLLYHEAGLKGLSGISADMRILLKTDDPRARLAIDHFVHRCGLYAGMLAAAMGGVDGFVFTAGIGENSPEIRARIIEKLEWLGADIDPDANASGATLISAPASKLSVYRIPTNEELVIAGETSGFLRKS
ncbi:acetate/propionate family kinase [Boseongicola aestuarii]|uniref:Acetate kinase n=1 Tax=Boseongicola aestuarii TaxID=1470561 RepID=A0A238IZB8_9RHOB|nr:acetate/propionate family kinase [Boseongicola aestuarii]SMX23215.1 Acetate kinase [Boseongicola aestuarii]